MVFGNLFSKFKKKKDEDFNYTLHNMKKGYFVDYNLKTWEVKDVYEYDWGNNNYSKEYKLFAEGETRFLYIGELDKVVLGLSKKININKLDPGLRDEVINNDQPPSKIVFEDKTYYLTDESLGHCKSVDDGKDDWAELVSWELVDEEEENFIAIERYGEREIEAAVGKYVEEYEFSSILPRNL